MKTMRTTLAVFLVAIVTVFSGCRGGSEQANANSQPAPVQKDDGSVVTVSELQHGAKLEMRTFASGEIEKVERISRPNGTRQALVYFRDNPSGTKGLTDPNDIERVMEASPDEIKQAVARASGK
jgi:hypothetical protein